MDGCTLGRGQLCCTGRPRVETPKQNATETWDYDWNLKTFFPLVCFMIKQWRTLKKIHDWFKLWKWMRHAQANQTEPIYLYTHDTVEICLKKKKRKMRRAILTHVVSLCGGVLNVESFIYGLSTTLTKTWQISDSTVEHSQQTWQTQH